MADRGWKQFERRLARDVGSERIPVTGERDGADFKAGMFHYQAKLRGVVPRWIGEWLGGICATATRHDPQHVGVLVLKRPGDRDEDALVIVRWKDWVDLHGRPEL